jgi:hypothetical protein
MGTTTKGILLSGVYLMLGIFTQSFHSADSMNGISAVRVAEFTQAEQAARVGLSLATGSETFNYTNWTGTITRTSVINDQTITYTMKRLTAVGAIERARITSTVEIKENHKNILTGEFESVSIGQVTMTGDYNLSNGRWRCAGIHTKTENFNIYATHI